MNNMVFNIKNYLKEKQSLVDHYLRESFPAEDVFPNLIHESMSYSLFAGGKRIRPILCLAATELCGGNEKAALAVGSAIEMIHTFSLVHDDLPAMDDDDLRRGKPTNHTIYGDAVAILAGDGLVCQAFEHLASIADLDSQVKLDLILDISRATGARGMIGGQILDIKSENKKISIQDLEKLHSLKTGALIKVSLTSGAKLSLADSKKIQSLEKYGDLIGLAFQVADDILDIVGGEELGKDQGSDLEKGKSTYPSILGLEEAQQLSQKLALEAKESLQVFDSSKATPLLELADYIVNRTY